MRLSLIDTWNCVQTKYDNILLTFSSGTRKVAFKLDDGRLPTLRGSGKAKKHKTFPLRLFKELFIRVPPQMKRIELLTEA